jgi:hypothetical protein
MGKKPRILTPDGTDSFHRHEVCQRALAPLFQNLCEQAQAAGWERREVAYALMVLAAAELKHATTEAETISEVTNVPGETGGTGLRPEEGD